MTTSTAAPTSCPRLSTLRGAHGSVPYSGQSDVAVLYAHLEASLPASERNPELPPAIDAVLARAWRRTRPSDTRRALSSSRDALRPRRSTSARAGLRRLGGRVGRCLDRRGGIVIPGVLLRDDDACGSTRAAWYGTTRGPVMGSRSARRRAGAIDARDGAVWVGSIREGDLWKITAATGAVEKITAIGSPRDIAIWGDTTYVASDGQALFTGTVVRTTCASGFRKASTPVLACSLTADATAVWAAGCPNLVEIELSDDGSVSLASSTCPSARPVTAETYRTCLCAMATGLGGVWVIGDWSDTRLWRIDPSTGRIATTFEAAVQAEDVRGWRRGGMGRRPARRPRRADRSGDGCRARR